MIPRTLAKEEVLVRGIVTPLFTKKKKLAFNAFLPPPGKSDVSLLRHSFTTDNFCMTHSRSLRIPNQEYCGMATIKVLHIDDVNSKSLSNLSALVVATPLDEHLEIIEHGDIKRDQKGLPMHADLIYSEPTIKGEVSTRHRVYASEVLKLSNYFPDPEAKNTNEQLEWKGKALCWEPKENNDDNEGAKVQIKE